MLVFDTNAILRYILQDNTEMADLVENELESSKCLIPAEVIAEMVYVLNKVYKIDRILIAQTILGILEIENILTPDKYVVSKAVEVYSQTKLDYGFKKTKGCKVVRSSFVPYALLL